MQLLILILKKVEIMDELIKELATAGVKGATILEGTGMAEALMNMEDVPIFGMLRRVLSNEEKEPSKVMMVALKDTMVKTTCDVVHNVMGDLNEPNKGILFTIPISYIEGIGD